MDTSSLVKLYDRLDRQKDLTKNTSIYNLDDEEDREEMPDKSDDLELPDNIDDEPDDTKQMVLYKNQPINQIDDELPAALRLQKKAVDNDIHIPLGLANRMRSLASDDDLTPVQYSPDTDIRWRQKLNHHCDKLKDGFCKHILVDLYCKILPLDNDYICKNQQMMSNDIDNFLARKQMNGYQYLTAAKDMTKAPLIDFIIREANRCGKRYYERTYNELSSNRSNGIELDPKEPKLDWDSLQKLTVFVREDAEYVDAVNKTKEKNTEETVNAINKQTDEYDEAELDNEEQYDDSNEEMLADQGEANNEVKDQEETSVKPLTPQLPLTPEQEKNERVNEVVKENLEKVYDKTKETIQNRIVNAINNERVAQQLEFDPEKGQVANVRYYLDETDDAPKAPELESVIALCLDYGNREIIKENVNMTPKLNEELIGLAIRESTLLQIDRLFKFTNDVTNNLQTRLFLNQCPVMNEKSIKRLIK